MKVSQNGVNLIKKFEGFKSKAYQCQAGRWTIGWGHTAGVYQGMTCTEAQAEKWLLDLLNNHYIKGVTDYVKVDLTQNQVDALVSFCYNLGRYILKGSTLLSYINSKQWDKAAAKMLEYCNYKDPKTDEKKKSTGLYNRRKEESALFVKGLNKTSTASTNTATVSAWKSESGTFTVTTPSGVKMRDSASTKGNLIAVIKKGEKVKYDAYKIDANGYVWIRQKRSSGYGYVPTGKSMNGKRINHWGTFK